MSKVGRITVVMDAQAGSCGKGKFIGYMALKDGFNVAINNFMSNAGHTWIGNDGMKLMTQHLPTSMVNNSIDLLIGPGSAITPGILIDEIRKYHGLLGTRDIFIHPRAMVISSEHIEKEKEIIRSGSTFKGCGVAQAQKIMRVPGTILMNEYYNQLPNDVKDYVVISDTAKYCNDIINMGGDILVEGSQGFDLDINYGLDYPHTTSRQCNAGQLVADCGISPRLVTDIYMIMRPYPIRISNETNIGQIINSGDYAGSKEITWNDIRDRCGAPNNIEFGEFTTVTKKLRRVFELNWERLKYAIQINRPTGIILNFVQYLDWRATGATTWRGLESIVQEFIVRVEGETGVQVVMVGTGPRNCDIVDLR